MLTDAAGLQPPFLARRSARAAKATTARSRAGRMCSSWPPASSTGPAGRQSTCRREKGQQLARCSSPIPPGLLPASPQHAGSRSILTAVQTPACGANNPAAALQRELTHSWVLQGTKKPFSSRKEHSEPGSVLQHRAGEESEVQSPPRSVPRTKPAETRGRKASRHRRAQGSPDGPAGDAQQQSRAAQSLSPLPGLKQNAAQPAAGFLQVEEHSCCWGRKQQQTLPEREAKSTFKTAGAREQGCCQQCYKGTAVSSSVAPQQG